MEEGTEEGIKEEKKGGWEGEHRSSTEKETTHRPLFDLCVGSI